MGGLASIDCVVVLMLENRSFDHMLGFLYADNDNLSLSGQPFAGLKGNESNPDAKGEPVSVFSITPSTPNAYLMPGADPGKGYMATNSQLFGTTEAPAPGATPAMQGFVSDFAYTLEWQQREGWSIVPGTTANDIMGCFTPQALPVLSALARGFAVCDQWFGSVPTETLPNRAFLCSGTSQGHMDDKTRTFTARSIFAAMSEKEIDWAVYGYDEEPLTRHTFTDITDAAPTHFGLFSDFLQAAKAGTLPAFTFLEPGWKPTGNSQHPNYNVARGEQLIHATYYALRNGPQWQQTLLIVTYDEHGGCYDHVAPPWGATPPDASVGDFGFDFTRFGPRVPTVLVSPLIEAGTVFRVPAGSTPLDHSSILKTLENRWQLPALTARDAAAVDVSGALTRAAPRTDDPLEGVAPPVSEQNPPEEQRPSHLQEVLADLISRQHPAGTPEPTLRTSADYQRYSQPGGALSRIILDPSVVFSDEALEWIADPELRPWLVVSEALMRHLEKAASGEAFRPYADPNPQRIAEVREALSANEVAVYSLKQALAEEKLSDEARAICERLASGDEPLGDVLADEWAFLTTQSLALIHGIARHALPAFARAGGVVIDLADDKMRAAIEAVRDRIPDPVLDIMKRADRAAGRIPPWLVAGGEIAGFIVPHVGLGMVIATNVGRGVVVLAGDP